MVTWTKLMRRGDQKIMKEKVFGLVLPSVSPGSSPSDMSSSSEQMLRTLTSISVTAKQRQ